MKKGILIVSFGTTWHDTRERNIEALVKEVCCSFPDCEVRQAYSSRIVRKVLKERDGMDIPDTGQALLQMKEVGIRQVLILPTHIIDGVENHRMKACVEQFSSAFESIRIAGALLEAEEDYGEVAEALWGSLREKAGERTVIMMGHGSSHEADASYQKLENALQQYAQQESVKREIYIATVEGSKTIEEVLERVQNRNRTVLLTPFMLVAGDHARNDMAGGENSFYTKARNAGFDAECLLKGIGEYPAIRKIYIRHLKKIDRNGM